MKFYIGTLYSGENEKDRCVESVKAQINYDFKHFIFKGYKRKEGHDALLRSYIESTYDVLIHLDSDMVFRNKYCLSVIARMLEDRKIEHLEFPVQDFYTNDLIWGLNVYRGVKGNLAGENVFTDFVPAMYKKTDFTVLADHSPDPSKFQGFCYGVGKAVKYAASNNRGWTQKSEYYRDIIGKTYHQFMETKDIRIGFAVLGVRAALMRMFSPEQLNYSDDILLNSFKEVKKFKVGDILDVC